jgi:hypothetical protein
MTRAAASLRSGQCTLLNCGSSWFNLAYQYNFAAGLISESTPVGFTLTPTYNSAARLKQLTSSSSDAPHPATSSPQPRNEELARANFLRRLAASDTSGFHALWVAVSTATFKLIKNQLPSSAPPSASPPFRFL